MIEKGAFVNKQQIASTPSDSLIYYESLRTAATTILLDGATPNHFETQRAHSYNHVQQICGKDDGRNSKD